MLKVLMYTVGRFVLRTYCCADAAIEIRNSRNGNTLRSIDDINV